ncbi:MAG: PEP/pyruvate-binding domain-containing protein, partial [Candidatus Hodarchaeales archaeon]
MSLQKWVYLFNEGNKDMRDTLGGKGANLAEMTNLNVNVPPGFTIITKASIHYNSNNIWPGDLEEQVDSALKKLESQSGLTFGKDLLVSVRSGAKFSMPGMMDTILNLGMNDDVIEYLSKKTGNPHFVWDSYRRFIQMFSDVAMSIPAKLFEDALFNAREKAQVKNDFDLNVDQLRELVAVFKEIYKGNKGLEFPQDPKEQLRTAITAVFRSWNTPRAIAYRSYEGISDDLGTAVNVQMMAFGNMGSDSGAGVLFTRNPSDGVDMIYGEYLVNSQGEDVVAGIRTPQPISKLGSDFPEILQALIEKVKMLENHYRDMQDIEFTIMAGKLYILQTRNGKRTGVAAIKIAHDLVKEGLISEEKAI